MCTIVSLCGQCKLCRKFETILKYTKGVIKLRDTIIRYLPVSGVTNVMFPGDNKLTGRFNSLKSVTTGNSVDSNLFGKLF